jgi:hypothetical protein
MPPLHANDEARAVMTRASTTARAESDILRMIY